MASAVLALRGFAPIVGGLVKERLTGAIILVALIVLLVPELLRGPVKSAPRTVAASAEEPPLRSYTINLGDDSQGRSAAAQPQASAPQPLSAPAAAPAVEGQPDTDTPPQSPTPAPPVPAPAPKAAPAPPATHASPAPAVAASADAAGAWMVQLGSFASRPNAEHLAQKLKSQGFAASVSQGTSGRHLYRVRVGPVRDKAAAAQLQGKLKAAGHSGAIVPR
jgi:DedD protein